MSPNSSRSEYFRSATISGSNSVASRRIFAASVEGFIPAMDDFGWGNPTMSTKYMTSGMWYNCGKLSGSREGRSSSMDENNTELVSPSLEAFQENSAPMEEPTSSCFGELVKILSSPLSSTTGALDVDMLQYQETVGSNSTVLLKSQVGTGFGGLPSLYETLTPINGVKSSGSTSISCLTEPFASSAANNDEDLSAILHACENLRNFDCSTNNSSESNRDEVMSQCSSNPEALREKKPRGTSGSKRRREDCSRAYERDLLRGSKSSSSAKEAEAFSISFSNEPKKQSKSGHISDHSSIDFDREEDDSYELDTEAIAQVKEMIYKAAALRPVSLGTEEVVEKPKRKNVRISSDPQTVAARHRRERISERLRVLQRLVPGGSKMDTASMLDEAASYLKFLKSQVKAMESLGSNYNRSFDHGALLATIGTAATAPFQLPMNHAFSMHPNLCHNPIPLASKRSGKAL